MTSLTNNFQSSSAAERDKYDYADVTERYFKVWKSCKGYIKLYMSVLYVQKDNSQSLIYQIRTSFGVCKG